MKISIHHVVLTTLSPSDIRIRQTPDNVLFGVDRRVLRLFIASQSTYTQPMQSQLTVAPQFGRHSISASKFGLLKNAIDCLAGVMASVSLIACAGGATTRWRVDRKTSLLQRESRSPTLMTIVPGMGVAGRYSPVCGFWTCRPPT